MTEDLCERKSALTSLLQVQDKGALIRSRFLSVRDMDAPTTYFLILKKSHKSRV